MNTNALFARIAAVAVMLMCAVALSAAQGDPPPSGQDPDSGDWKYIKCNNGGKWIWCADCPREGYVNDEACFKGASKVSNLNKGYLHDAIDYRVSTEGGGGCAPCGSAVGNQPANGLANLTITRMHRSRPGAYSGSFGTSVYAPWDLQVTLEWTINATTGVAGPVIVRLFDPANLSIKLSFEETSNGETAVDGVLRDAAGGYRNVQLLAADGSLTALGANATQVRLTAHDGTAWFFDIINVANSTVTRQGRLVSQVDRNGQLQSSVAYRFAPTATLAELGNDRQRLWQVSQVGDAYGRTAAVTYDNAAKHGSRYAITRIGLPNGAAVQYAYTGANLSSVTHPTGEVSTFMVSYDTRLQKNRWVINDPAAEPGHQSKTVWMTGTSWKDPVTGVVSTQPSGLTVRVDNAAGETIYANQPDPANANYFYFFEAGYGYLRLAAANDVFQAPTEVARASSSVFTSTPWTLAWTPVGAFTYTGTELRNGASDALGRKWAFTVDQKTRNITKTVHADGSISSAAFNAFSQPLTETDRLGRVTTSTYDAQGNRLTRTVGNGAEAAMTQWSYNARGQIASMTDANGKRTDYEYDAIGQLTAIVEPADLAGDPRARRTFTYDTAGRLKTATDAGNRTVSFDYDDRNRVVRRTYADTSYERIVYVAGLIQSEFDRNQVETRYGYDAAGRRISTTRSFARPEAVVETCSWVSGSATLKQSCVQSGERIEYGYDSRYRLVSTTRTPRFGVALTESRAYDLFDRLASVTDAYGRRTSYVYDRDDHVVRTVRELVPGATPDAATAFTAQRAAARTAFQLAGFGGMTAIGSATDVSMTATAYGLNSTADKGSLWSRQLVGDGTLVVRLADVQAGPVAMYGLMLRGDLSGGSPMASVYLNPQNGSVGVRWRSAAGQASTYATMYNGALPLALPRWLRLVRTGDIIKAGTSVDGVTWTSSSALTVPLPVTVEAGCFMNVISGVATWPVAIGFDSLACSDADWAGQSAVRQLTYSSAWQQGLVRTAHSELIIEDQTFDVAGQLASRIDGRGIRGEWTYDSQGRVKTQTEAVGSSPATTGFAYDLVGNRTAVTSPRGMVTATTYTGRNLVRTVTEAAQDAAQATVVRTVTYSPTGKVASETDALGRTTLFAYGTCCDRLVCITDPAGFTTHFTYDFVGNRLTVRDGNSLVTTTGYDGLRRPLGVTNALNEATVYGYDDNLTDGAGIDAVPAVAAVLPGLGLVAGVADGSAVSVRDAANATSYELRDGLGRSVARIDALGHVSTMTYDALVGGLVETAQSDALGHVTRSRSDGAGRTRQQVDALGKLSTATWDAVGNQLSQRDAMGLGWDAFYSARGFLLQRSDTRVDLPGSTSWGYDLDGNRTSETDALGKTESYAYDLRNRRTLLTDRLGGKTRFAYDAVGNLIRISDADNESKGALDNLPGTTQYAYDPRNLLVAETFPSGQAGRTLRTYGYDGGHRLTQRQVGILAGAFSAAPVFSGTAVATNYAYDNANRLITRSYADGLHDGFGYDATGRLLVASSARYATTVARQYDVAGRLTQESLSLPDGSLSGTVVAPATYAVGYAYSNDNRLTGLTYPTGSQVVRGYSARHELATVQFAGTPVAMRQYDDSGRLASTTLGNGLVESRGYVPGSPLVQSIAVPAVTGFGYTYDAVGRKLNETSAFGSGQSFGYDDAGRVIAWQAGAATQSWNLSLVGDWNTTTSNGVAEARVNTAVHEATQVGSNLLTYDLAGNLTKDEHQTALAWDPENRLTRAIINPDASTTGFGAIATYRYDALGRRIAKTVQDRTTLYLPAGAQTVVELERTAIPAQAAIDGAEADGTLANMALAPASGGILPGSGVTRVNFQPAMTVVPAGFVKDSGKVVPAVGATRTNGMTYGWTVDRTAQAVARHGAVPLVEFDTFVQAQPDAGGSASWSIALPNGSYPVVVVAGDAMSTEQTNNLVIGGQTVTDPTPSASPAYEAGNFDGYAVQATVSNGTLTITPAASAYHAKLCFVEIGAVGTTISQATKDRLAALVAKANGQTGASPEPVARVREFVYGSYVDEVVAYQQTVNGVTSRYYPHYNHLYSVAALTNAVGAVVERFTYDAYGKQTVTAPVGGVVRAKSVVGWDRGFTGYISDNETGLLHAHEREFSSSLGRFTNRDPITHKEMNGIGYPDSSAGYYDGYSLYAAYFVPNTTDPSGMESVCETYLFAGHLDEADAYIDIKTKNPDGTDKKLPCGTRVGTASCMTKHRVGRIPEKLRIPGNEGLPNSDKLINCRELYDQFKALIEKAKKEAEKQCKECKCDRVYINVDCSPAAKMCFGGQYWKPNGKVNDYYDKTVKDPNLCPNTITINCPNSK